jgi:hypothetical protein
MNGDYYLLKYSVPFLWLESTYECPNYVPRTTGSHTFTCLCRHIEEAEVQILPIRNTALERGEWSAPLSCRFTPKGVLRTHYTGGWVGLEAGLEGHEKSRPHRDSIAGPSSP